MFIRGPFRNKCDLILASKSPRRQSLLTSLGINFYVQPSKIKEPDPKDYTSAHQYVKEAALLKALDVFKSFPDHAVLSADTVVVQENKILGKPKDFLTALNFLQNLKNTTHQVVSGICLLFKDQKRLFSVETSVYMEDFSENVLKAYIQTNEPFDKAGGYGIQGIGAFLIKEINGSYTNVVGLPLTETTKALLELGIIDIEQNE